MKLLLYCTKAKPMLRVAKEEFKGQKRARTYSEKEKKYFTEYIAKAMYEANGKIVAECDFEVEEIEKGYGTHHTSFDEEGYFDDFYDYMTKTIDEDILLKRSCLNVVKLEIYNPNYAIHIKNLHIFDEPKELSDYESFVGYKKYYQINDFVKLEKAPQNMCKILKPYIRFNRDFKVYEDFDILISISPEWLCKILNGEKTVEVRKKVLKEMLNHD